MPLVKNISYPLALWLVMVGNGMVGNMVDYQLNDS